MASWVNQVHASSGLAMLVPVMLTGFQLVAVICCQTTEIFRYEDQLSLASFHPR